MRRAYGGSWFWPSLRPRRDAPRTFAQDARKPAAGRPRPRPPGRRPGRGRGGPRAGRPERPPDEDNCSPPGRSSRPSSRRSTSRSAGSTSPRPGATRSSRAGPSCKARTTPGSTSRRSRRREGQGEARPARADHLHGHRGLAVPARGQADLHLPARQGEQAAGARRRPPAVPLQHEGGRGRGAVRDGAGQRDEDALRHQRRAPPEGRPGGVQQGVHPARPGDVPARPDLPDLARRQEHEGLHALRGEARTRPIAAANFKGVDPGPPWQIVRDPGGNDGPAPEAPGVGEAAGRPPRRGGPAAARGRRAPTAARRTDRPRAGPTARDEIPSRAAGSHATPPRRLAVV